MRDSKRQSTVKNSNLLDDADNPWKEILELMLPSIIAFFFPKAFEAIDWTRGYRFLDNEFRKILRDAEQINRRVDKLVQVHLKSGKEVWLLLHIEIQGYRDVDFPRRMFVSWYRIFDKYNLNVISFAILTDDDPFWKHGGFNQDLLETKVSHDFRTIKLMDFKGREAEPEANPNPVAIIVLTHLDMLATKNKPSVRRLAKVNRVSQLYIRGLSRKEVINLFKFIDWLLALPPPEAIIFEEKLAQIEKENRMPYITSVERHAMKRGIEQGLRESIIDLLEMRFSQIPDDYLTKLNDITIPSPKTWQFL